MGSSPVLNLDWISGSYAIWRIDPADALAASIGRLLDHHGRCTRGGRDGGAARRPPGRSTLLSVTSTSDEMSIVCDESMVPPTVRAERGFVAMRVAGTLDMGLVGVLQAIARPLADAGVPILAISTFDTDYVLVRAAHATAATAALCAAGHRVGAGG